MKKPALLNFKQLLIFVVLLFMGNTLFAYSAALQERFRWRNDDGSETEATWETNTINVPISNVASNENIRIRFVLDETKPGSFAPAYAFQMNWSTSPAGTYTAFSDAAGSAFKISSTTNFTNGDPTTEQIGTGNGLTWEPLGICVDVDGSNSITLTDAHFIEMEYCLQPTDDAIAGQTYFFSSQGLYFYGFNGVDASSIFASFTMATSSGAPIAHDNTAPAGTGAQEVTGTNTGATVKFLDVTIAGPMNFDRWDVAPPNNPPANVMAKYWSISQGTTQFSGTFNLTLPTTGIVGYTPEQLFIFHRANEESSWTKLSNVSVVNVSSLQVTGLSTFGQFTIAPRPDTPTIQATNVLFENISTTQMDINWTRGSGSHCAAFIFDGNSSTALPVNGTAYTANTVFGTGDQIGSTGWYCIYNGSEVNPTVTVTGLTLLTEYRVQVCEYSVFYNADVATGNPANKTTIPLSGTGISGNPYQISTLDHLAWLSDNSDFWSFHFIQTTNIDATATSGWNGGEGFIPIGPSYDNAFSGTYDGQNHTIDKLFINRTAGNHQAMFGSTLGATIKNLGLTNVSITSNSYGGALIGEMQTSNISNCYSSGTVNLSGGEAGGLIGFSGYSGGASTLSDCYSSCTVNGTGGAGGLISYLGNGSTISNSYSTGDVTSTGSNVGGLIGMLQNNTVVTNCYSTGNVVSSSFTVGGLVGHVWESETINNSYATGNVTGTDDMGGFVGHLGGSSITDCYSRGDITDTDGGASGMGSGAFLGYAMGGQINNSFATGSVYYSVGANPTDKGFVADYYVGHVTFSDNFFDSEESNQTTGTGATAEDTDKMKDPNTFVNAGWDFASDWSMKSDYNDGYPNLDGESEGYDAFTWTGVYSSAWEDMSNWAGGEVPNGTVNVVISDVGYSPVIAPEVGATCYNLTVNASGVLTINSDGSLITKGTITNNGDINIQRTITDYVWHLVSSPVTNATASVFAGEYLQYWTEPTGTWDDVTTSAFGLDPVKGYSLWGVAKSSTTYNFSGTPNTGDQSVGISASGSGEYSGTNLLGNPYPSSIDWSELDDTYGAVYYWTGTQYAIWINNVTTNGGVQYIPPMQGFFIVTGSTGTFSLSNENRTHLRASDFYKSTTENTLSNGLVLTASNEAYTDELYVVLNDAASPDFELQRDAYKFMSGTPGLSEIYSFGGDKRLSIDVRPECNIIPLGFANDTDGFYSIGLKEMAGITEAVLEDTKTNTFHDLTKGAYEFTWNVTDDEKRFKLHLKAVGIEETQISESNILIYAADGQIFIKGAESEKMQVVDMMGRIVLQQNISASELTAIPVNLKTGVYVVMVNGAGEQGSMLPCKTEKVFIK